MTTRVVITPSSRSIPIHFLQEKLSPFFLWCFLSGSWVLQTAYFCDRFCDGRLSLTIDVWPWDTSDSKSRLDRWKLSGWTTISGCKWSTWKQNISKVVSSASITLKRFTKPLMWPSGSPQAVPLTLTVLNYWCINHGDQRVCFDLKSSLMS